MLKRLFSPLTLANQLAMIVLLLAFLGMGGMALAGWLAQGVQGSAHAINKAGSLRMQSYRLLAAVPVGNTQTTMFNDMERTAWSDELEQAAVRDGQQAALQSIQHYWRQHLSPALRDARSPQEVSAQVAQFVGQIDALVSAFDSSTERRIAQVVMLQRGMALLMGLLLLFTLMWLRRRLLRPWRQLLAIAHAVAHRDFSQRASVSGRDEMATLGRALNSMSAELAESYASLEQRVQEKTAGLEQKNQILSFLWEANRRLHSDVPLCERLAPVLTRLQSLTLLRDIALRVYEVDDEEHYQEFVWQPDERCDEIGCHLCPRQLPAETETGTTLKCVLAMPIPSTVCCWRRCPPAVT